MNPWTNIKTVLVVLAGLAVAGSATPISGNSYAERAKALIDLSVTTHPSGAEPKYSGPYLFAKLLRGSERDWTLGQIGKMYDRLNANPILFYQSSSGSDLQFYAHGTMHGYQVTKALLPDSLKTKIRTFFTKYNLAETKSGVSAAGGTLNMWMMHVSSAYLAAEEWPDLIDSVGHNSQQILAYTKPLILKQLDVFFRNNCPESDAFVYYGTNVQYVRMLAEFSRDPGLKAKAYATYQHMIAAMAHAWNQGLYVATPTRSKGWGDLVSGTLTPNPTTVISWLYFGSRSNTIDIVPSTTVTNNVFAINFWTTYPGMVSPDSAILSAYTNKVYPYSSQSLVDAKNSWKYYKQTYQSKNYGLASQSEEVVYNYPKASSTYAWKETKRVLLYWQSAVRDHYFSPSQDNPMRPTDTLNANGIGYGENPFHRVLQSKNTVIGIYDVPAKYLNGKRYRTYVPFSKTGIKIRKDTASWTFCHTGSMLFAYRSTEPTEWNAEPRFAIKNFDILTVKDTTIRRGSWVLETSEIGTQYQGATDTIQLEKFKQTILAKTKMLSLSYVSDSSRIKYLSLNGDTLDLTYYSPMLAYSNQRKINGNVQKFPTPDSLFQSPTIAQRSGSDSVLLSGNRWLVNPAPQVALYASIDSLQSVNPFLVTLTFSTTPVGLTLSDLVVSNGKASALTGTDRSYSVTITPTTLAPVTITFPAGGVKDLGDNAFASAKTISIPQKSAEPVSVDPTSTLGSIYGKNHRLHFDGFHGKTARIFGLDGTLLLQESINKDHFSIAFPNGVYLIEINGKRAKQQLVH